MQWNSVQLLNKVCVYVCVVCVVCAVVIVGTGPHKFQTGLKLTIGLASLPPTSASQRVRESQK